MGDEATSGQDPTGETPPTGDTGGTPPPADQGQAPSGSPEAELARARSEAAKYRTELRDAQKERDELRKAQQERDDAEKSELQKANDQVSRLEADLAASTGRTQDAYLEVAVVNAAVKQGIVDPEAAYRLLDRKAVEWDGDRPTNIDALLTALVEAKPYLKGQPRTGGPGPSATAPATGGKKPLTREDVQRMTSQEINERWDEVQKVLAASP